MSGRSELDAGFIKKSLFVAGLIGACWLVIKLTPLWLLVFGAILFAQILRVMAEPLFRYTPIPEGVAILLAFAAIVGLIGGSFYWFGRDLVTQLNGLIEQIPTAWATLQSKLLATHWGDEVLAQLNQVGAQGSKALSLIPAIASDIVSSLANLLVVVVGGIFIALNARDYSQGVVKLFPKAAHNHVWESLLASLRALRRWLLGQFISMVVVGGLVGLGLWLLGVPSAMALGLIAGLAQFVPIVGPVIATVPGLIMAGSSDWHTLGYAALLYVGVSQFEANILTPMVQKSVAEVPVVLTLFAVIGFALLLGPLGIVFASPLTVILFTLVKKLYVDNGWHEAEEPHP